MDHKMTGINADLSQRFNYEIMRLEHLRQEYNKRLDHLGDSKGALLRWTSHGKRKYYYVKRSDSDSYKYVNRSRQRDVQRIKEARFLEEAIRWLDHDVALLEGCIDGFLPFDSSSINEGIPEIYRCNVVPSSELYESESKKWLSARLDFQKKFPENYPERKKQRTSDGVMVKTVSEVVMYEMLKSAGLALIYELPLPMEDYGPVLYPDMTVLSPIDMETEIIIEYVGRLDLREYRESFARKISRYMASGFTPGVNLFFVFSDNNGNVDSLQIAKVIADILGIRNTLKS